MNQASLAAENASRVGRSGTSEKWRRRILIAVVVLCLVLVALIAGTCRRFMPSNTDAGAGEVATGSLPELTVIQTGALVPLVPGDSAQTLRGTFTNSGSAPVYVTSVTASLSGVTGNRGPCTTADYLLRDPVMSVDRDIPVGDGVGGWSGATIQMVHLPEVSQDGCKLATLEIAYVIR